MEANSAESATTEVAALGAPSEPIGRLFVRFLKFGLLAWGGPVAQIGMIRTR
jgi:chromate transporter